jgi:hypothetical protein
MNFTDSPRTDSTVAKRPADTSLRSCAGYKLNAILQWIQTTHMAFYKRRTEMTMKRGQKIVYIFFFLRLKF